MVVIGISKKFNYKDIKQFVCKLTGLVLLNIDIGIEAEVQATIDLIANENTGKSIC